MQNNELNSIYFDATQRSRILLGDSCMDFLRTQKVAVLGLGGVGGIASEALARSGIGKLLILDKDCFELSNLNRQIGAKLSSIHSSKTSVMKERLEQVMPGIEIVEKPCFLVPDMNCDFLKGYDYILDCMDHLPAKIYLAEKAREFRIPLLMATGTARKKDPTKLKICDLFETKEDPLCKILRRELRKKDFKKQAVLFSSEPVSEAKKVQGTDGKKAPIGSLMFVPATAGLLMAHFVISELLKKDIKD